MAYAVPNDLIGKEVRIYPSDSYRKQGIVQSIDTNGVLFKITKSSDSEYKVGALHFIAFSARLSFAEL